MTRAAASVAEAEVSAPEAWAKGASLRNLGRAAVAALRLFVFCVALVVISGVSVQAQEAPPEPLSEEELARRAAEAEAAVEALSSIRGLLDAQIEKQKEREAQREAFDAASNEVDAEQTKQALEALDAEIAEIDAQIERLATGASGDEIATADDLFDIQAEIEGLVEPFILIVKSATENARAIAKLERERDEAADQTNIAQSALDTLGPILEAAPEDAAAAERLRALRELWIERRDAAEARNATAERQLELRRAEQFDAGESASEAAESFVRNRGRNLIFGILAFAGVFFGLRLVKRFLIKALGETRSRTFAARLGGLIFDGLAMIAAFGAILTVFNYYNDWLLTGLTILLLLALGWVFLMSLPSMIEQLTLLLNLGAVQEGERVVIDGVPWLVRRLDFYTDLTNPALRGGAFTVPARKLLGLHSRPVGDNEAWFPTEEGDWVLIGDDLFGEVAHQSPEMVQVRKEGGAVVSFPIAGFLEANPVNLSKGFRATASLGLDYRHQAQALTEIPSKLKASIDVGLERIVDRDMILAVDAMLVSAGDSALEFELEADLTGDAAPLYEDICDALTQIAVACSIENGWVIPTPQLTIHQR